MNDIKRMLAFILCIGFFLSGLNHVTTKAASDEMEMRVIEVSTEDELSAAFGQITSSSRIKIKVMNDLNMGYQYISRGETILDLNGHTLKQVIKPGRTSATLYISAYGGNADFTIENGTLYTENEDYNIRIGGADGTMSRVTLNHVTIINKAPNTVASGGSRNVDIANSNNRVTIKNSYLYSEEKFNICAFKGCRKEEDNAIRIENTSMLAYGNSIGLWAESGTTADEARPLYLSESSLQSFSATSAIYAGGNGEVGIIIPSGQTLYNNAKEQSVQTDIRQEIPTGMLIQTGKPEDFHTLTLQSMTDCNCQLRGTGAGTKNAAITTGKFATDRTIALSTSTEKAYEFWGYKADSSDACFLDELGKKETNAKTGFFKMPSQDVTVEGRYELPNVISAFKYKMQTVPTVDNEMLEVCKSITLADGTESRYSTIRRCILDNDSFLKKEYNNIDDIVAVSDLCDSTLTFEYGKTYYIVIVSRHNPGLYSLMDGYGATLNDVPMTYVAGSMNEAATWDFQMFYLPIKTNWCGKTLQEEVTWRYDAVEKCLSIEGEGDLQTYATSEFPWKAYSSEIETLKIGKKITNAEYLIHQMPSFKSVDVEDGNPELAVADGVVYTKKEGKPNKLIYIPSEVTSFAIPDSVATIGVNAGKDAANVKEITLGLNVSSIEEKAFAGCSALEVIRIRNKKCVIADSADTIPVTAAIEATKSSTAYQYVQKYSRTFVAPKEIGAGSSDSVQWSYDAETKTLTISGTGAMENFTTDIAPWKEEGTIANDCKKVVIEDGVTSIGTYAFYGMKKIEEVDFGSTVQSIGEMAFFDEMAGALKRIVVAEDNECYMVKNNLLYTKDGSSALLYATGSAQEVLTVEEGTTSLSDFLFIGAKNLKKIELPDTLKEIGSGVFMGSSITGITIPRTVEHLGEHVFTIASELETITLLNPAMTVETDSFSGMISKVTVYIHEDTMIYHTLSTHGVTVKGIHYYEMILDRAATTKEEGSQHEECWFCHDKKEAVIIPKLPDKSDIPKMDVPGTIKSSIDAGKGTVKSDKLQYPSVKIKSLKNKKKRKVVVKWKKVKDFAYYEIQYSLNKKFKSKKKYKTTTKKTKKSSITIKKLKKNKNYYFRVRGVSSKGVKGSFGKAKKVKVKK